MQKVGVRIPLAPLVYRAVLVSANLNRADLRDATLPGADLTGADFRDAILAGTDLRDVTIKGARLGGADLTGARWSEGAQVTEGWKLHAGSGRLERQATEASSPGPAAAALEGREPDRLEDRPTA